MKFEIGDQVQGEIKDRSGNVVRTHQGTIKQVFPESSRPYVVQWSGMAGTHSEYELEFYPTPPSASWATQMMKRALAERPAYQEEKRKNLIPDNLAQVQSAIEGHLLWLIKDDQYGGGGPFTEVSIDKEATEEIVRVLKERGFTVTVLDNSERKYTRLRIEWPDPDAAAKWENFTPKPEPDSNTDI